MKEYIPGEIEPKWQKVWAESKVFETPQRSDKKKFYNLVMFPYPSGTLHVGHVKNYVIGDIVARYKRMKGYNVLHPFGYDAFGLPAENAAIKNKIHPEVWTFKNIDIIRNQIKKIGISYDWSREVITCTEEYYKWTQWIFLKLYENGLAYKKKAAVNWCPSCQTVLANEQVVDGKCERCGTEVTMKHLEQWYFKITDYAEKLLNDIDKLRGWPENVKIMQKNWIGKSTGAEIDFPVDRLDMKIKVFTTRPDTIWGVTFMAIAPESPLVEMLVTDERKDELSQFLKKVSLEDRFKRTSLEAEKEGFFLGRYAINPVTGEKIPIYVANYILYEYGTGAIMAVPAHDQRDFDFAKKYGISIRVVIDNPEESIDVEKMEKAYEEEGIMVNSGPFNGMRSTLALEKIIEYLEEKGIGKRSVQYKLRDWLISRQRYWGAPIPIVYCEKCGIVPVPEKDLPVKLPKDVEFLPTGQSPLSLDEQFLNTTCPKCGGPAKREADTMDTFVDSSWYYLRYINPKLEDKPFDTEDINYWMPVDQYIGGVEHAVLHLLYSRFITKVLYDLGYLKFEEPFENLFTQGMIYKDGWKMSKSKGNVVSPDEMIEKYGADTLRTYILFMAPPEKDAEWSDAGIEGVNRFLKRLWNNIYSILPRIKDVKVEKIELKNKQEKDLRRKLHQSIKKITEDIEGGFKFNTAIAGLMELNNNLSEYLNSAKDLNLPLLRELVEKLTLILSPFAPHMAEEIWHDLGNDTLVVNEEWPAYDENALKVDEVTVIIQINGKVRGKIQTKVDVSEGEIKKLAFENAKIASYVDGREIVKVIYVKNKLLNIVVK
ncbi:leucine--tRNA ligase [Thermosipho melanesiensis]|uniref:Leucine--tRNA ligase n=2 Tax=Thermosipho melanesiensis TaxID=46541 RepID=SYL_THEM4|nr:leucine--tRNA ligase [Thermosipho melanesiensis]A6LJM9.1 RecName: Full=Leucine--tRNA ligase; AltName: Full=Leucyl-tRNA synthetase; Short=LeuRS [Thermosipho melanesiensis BI429]ABR30130.1 leucyl-tRNA synthetase [Thermosipho melanesiensis BI429]APT73327.1 leucine--tRNA ligase [Thermosipho melanesiensis]OOC38717.1 leucine--tRNA ligase [Thermosipho melanesiensis]OOC40521.1 leucine--tRNA ligase [Thermosipho melanesiensis]OOC40786.1 leucine--tRNA ligase [Thermosipho melanesiensis]